MIKQKKKLIRRDLSAGNGLPPTPHPRPDLFTKGLFWQLPPTVVLERVFPGSPSASANPLVAPDGRVSGSHLLESSGGAPVCFGWEWANLLLAAGFVGSGVKSPA